MDTLDQRYVLMPAAMKDAYLVHVVHKYLQKNSASSVMIFTNTCKSVLFFSAFISLFLTLTGQAYICHFTHQIFVVMESPGQWFCFCQFVELKVKVIKSPRISVCVK